MGNAFCHIELSSTDLDKSKSFYSELFDWKLSAMPMPEGEYTMIDVGDSTGTGGGMMQSPVPGMPSFWMAYVAVDDLDASTAKAEALGAEIVVPRMEVAGYGVFSVFKDPTGATLAMWQQAAGAD